MRLRIRLRWLASAVAVVLALGINPALDAGTSPSPVATTAPSKVPSASASSTAEPVASSSPAITQQQSLLYYLSQSIGWYRQVSFQESLVDDPAEMLIVSDNRTYATDALRLAFDYARAEAVLIAQLGPAEGETPEVTEKESSISDLPSVEKMQKSLEKSNAALAEDQAQIKALQAQLARATKRDRDALNQKLVAAQNQLDIDRSRIEFMSSLVQFETESPQTQTASSGLPGQIDELERSTLPQSTSAKSAGNGASPAFNKSAAEPSGIYELSVHLYQLQSKIAALSGATDNSNALLLLVAERHRSLVAALRQIDDQVRDLAKLGTANGATFAQRRKTLQTQISQRKLVLAALLPLDKQAVLIRRFNANLAQWRKQVQQHLREDLHAALIKLLGVALVMGLILGGGLVWRKLTFRLVEDMSRRRQILKIRNVVIGLLILIVLLINFISQLSALATVLGFAAAGIAVALQDVILSVAAYFRLSSRFGVKPGDIVEVQGVRGEVIDVGLTKLTLMELGSDGAGYSPTGRVVVIPNSSVFRDKFVNQPPDSSLIWTEVRLTLAADCDYRLVEKRLLEVVEQVFARYRDSARRQWREMERRLNVRIESPKPLSRIRISSAGIDMTLRYPVETENFAQVVDEVSRRLLDVLAQEPMLKLVSPGVPNIQSGGGSPPSTAGAASA